jgi:hypothetical protein
MKLTGLWIIARFEEGVTLEAAGGPGRVHSVSRLILACRVDHTLEHFIKIAQYFVGFLVIA